MYQLYTNPQAEDAVTPIPQITLLEYGVTDKTANISAKSDPYAEGKYLLPYRKNAANIGFNGLNWNTSKYLYLLVTSNSARLPLFQVLMNMKVLPFIKTPDGAEMMELYEGE